MTRMTSIFLQLFFYTFSLQCTFAVRICSYNICSHTCYLILPTITVIFAGSFLKKIKVWLPPVSNQPLALPELHKREHRDLKDLLESDPYALSVSIPIQAENYYVSIVCLLNNIIPACINMCVLFNRMRVVIALSKFPVYLKIEFGGTRHVMQAQTNHLYNHQRQHVQLADLQILFLGCYSLNIHIYRSLLLLFTY
jgi:hypothetical protein